jgi:NodT family efflux transporter outer membrane factor (OMF) lipoprotein
VLLSGCQNSFIQPETQQHIPFAIESQTSLDQEQRSAAPIEPPPSAWIESFNDAQLNRWVNLAMTDNFSLAEAQARVEAARQQRSSTRSNLWPTLDLELSSGRQKSNSGAEYQNTATISAGVAWEMDLWGKLSNTRTAADFRWQAEQARLQASTLSLSGQIAKAWFQVISAKQLSQLLKQRNANLNTNLEIIQSGYRQGINSALDVYLAQSDLSSEASNLTQQLAAEKNTVRQLQLLLGQYPSGTLSLADNKTLDLPALGPLNNDQLMSQNVRHRPDLQASYLELLASDNELAVAHKKRFPSFRLTGSTGDSSNELKNLLDSSSLAWSLLGGLTQPVFAGGKLKALEQQQQAIVQQKEQQYLAVLHTAFNEVEQSITNESALKQQLQLVEASKGYAEAAKDLAFEEYRQGLQNYTSVLEAQRRAFGAQNTVISIRNQLLQNRINLYLALGGDYQ